jgi:hypothetical protein
MNQEIGFICYFVLQFDSGTTIREDVTEVWEMRLARNRRNLTHGGSQTHYGIPVHKL